MFFFLIASIFCSAFLFVPYPESRGSIYDRSGKTEEVIERHKEAIHAFRVHAFVLPFPAGYSCLQRGGSHMAYLSKHYVSKPCLTRAEDVFRLCVPQSLNAPKSCRHPPPRRSTYRCFADDRRAWQMQRGKRFPKNIRAAIIYT